MLSVGNVGADGDNYTVFTQTSRTQYKKLVLQDDCVVGALFQGDITGTGIWQYLIKIILTYLTLKNHCLYQHSGFSLF